MRRVLTILLLAAALLLPAAGAISTLEAQAAVAEPYMDDSGDNRQTGGDFFYVYMGNGVFWRCSYSTGVCGPF